MMSSTYHLERSPDLDRDFEEGRREEKVNQAPLEEREPDL